MKKQNQKGITLIALIITIIVMLILVGVTINVALNGGLFQKAETATYQTEASLVKEQLEIAKAIELANAEGKEIEDYSYIKVENLDGLDPKTKTKFKDIILVNSNGDVCYNPANVTDEEKTMLEAIGINAYESNQLTAEELEEIKTLILQYSMALESNNTVDAKEAAEALQQKGAKIDETMRVTDQSASPDIDYIYEYNLKLMINTENLDVIIPTKNEIQILDELYNIAVCFDNALKNERPGDQENFSITYKGEIRTAIYGASDWWYDFENYRIHKNQLDREGIFFIGI